MIPVILLALITTLFLFKEEAADIIAWIISRFYR
jgi:hypothetical protein